MNDQRRWPRTTGLLYAIGMVLGVLALMFGGVLLLNWLDARFGTSGAFAIYVSAVLALCVGLAVWADIRARERGR